MISRYASHQNSLSDYSGGKNLSTMSLLLASSSDAQSLAAYGYLKSHSARNSSESYSNQFSIGLGILAIVYIYNIVDSYSNSSKPENKNEQSSFFWNVNYNRDVTWERSSSPRYSLELTWRF